MKDLDESKYSVEWIFENRVTRPAAKKKSPIGLDSV